MPLRRSLCRRIFPKRLQICNIGVRILLARGLHDAHTLNIASCLWKPVLVADMQPFFQGYRPMKTTIVLLGALALTPIGAYAHDDVHHGMMHGKAADVHAGDEGHAQGLGEPGNPKKVSRRIQVLTTDDMTFTPARVTATRGETIRFMLKNAGRTKHEMVIGSMAELKEHVEMMRKMPGMEHDDPNQVTLAPGETGELVWQFTKAGTVDFGCVQPGHLEAGKMGKVSVK